MFLTHGGRRFSAEHASRVPRVLIATTVLVVLVSLIGLGWRVTSAAASATLCSGSSYSACTGMGYTDHGYSTHSGTSYWGAYTGHNCTNYVAYVETQNGVAAPSYSLGDAYQWWSQAYGHVTESTTTPVVGSVAWWGSGSVMGSDGHVAYVEAVTGGPGAYTITISEDAFSSGPFDWKTIAQGDTLWPGGFIYFANLGRTPKGIDALGALNVFTTAGDNGLYQQYWNGTNWTGFTNIGVGMLSAPTVLLHGSTLELFARAGDNQVYHEYNTGSGWSGWSSLGSHTMAGNAAAIMRTSTEMDVFAVDTNKVPYEATWTASGGWGSGWYSLGNYMAYGASPSVILYGGEMDLFYRGGDNQLYKNTTFDGAHWGGFGSLGAPSGTAMVGDPSAMTYTPGGEYDIYINTAAGHIYKRGWTGSGWTNWTDMGGPAGGGSFLGSPFAIQYGSDMYVFARDSNNHIELRFWSAGNQTWSGWTTLAGDNLDSDPSAVLYGSQLTVLANAGNGKTDLNTYTPGSGWGGFNALP